MSCLLIECCKCFVLCLLYITDTTSWQAICIHVSTTFLAHFQRTTCSQIYFRFNSYLILTWIGWFIVNIQSDLFWHRCLERQTFGTPRMRYQMFHPITKMYTTTITRLLSLTAYKYAPNLESLLTQQYVCVMCTLWYDNTCIFTLFL